MSSHLLYCNNSGDKSPLGASTSRGPKKLRQVAALQKTPTSRGFQCSESLHLRILKLRNPRLVEGFWSATTCRRIYCTAITAATSHRWGPRQVEAPKSCDKSQHSKKPRQVGVSNVASDWKRFTPIPAEYKVKLA